MEKNQFRLASVWSKKGAKIGVKYGVLRENNGKYELPQDFYERLGRECRKEIKMNTTSLFETVIPFIWRVSFLTLGRYLKPTTYCEDELVDFTDELAVKVQNHMIFLALTYGLLTGSMSTKLRLYSRIKPDVQKHAEAYIEKNDIPEFNKEVLVLIIIDLIRKKILGYGFEKSNYPYLIYLGLHTFFQLDGWFDNL